MSDSDKKGLRLSLKLKLSLLITSLLVLTVFLVSSSLLLQEQKSLTAEMTKRGLTIARDLGASVRNPLMDNDELTLNLLVKDAMKDRDVAYVFIVDTDGKILAYDDVTLIGKPIDRPKELIPLGKSILIQTYTDPQKGRVIDFGVPLVFSQVSLGSLYLGFSQKTIEETLAATRNQTIWISALMVLLGIGGAMALAEILSRPIFRLVGATKKIAAGNFQVSLPVRSNDEIGTLTDAFNQMAKNLREKEMIKQAFSRYVAKEVVEEILKNPEQIALTGERRDVTVLFCDMRGFTPLSERLPPEEVVATLNEFYTLMIDTTFKHDGTLDKFLGDAVMAVFGAPVRHEDHCIRAIQTALAMQAGIAELSKKRVREGKEAIAIGIGVSAGEAVAGTVGTENRMEYTVIGDRVNLAARLESNAKPGQILISQMTYDKVARLVNARSLGVMRVKGKEEEVAVYEVLGLIDESKMSA